jgi:hypothetical protein
MYLNVSFAFMKKVGSRWEAAFDPSSQETEAGGSPAWATQ